MITGFTTSSCETFIYFLNQLPSVAAHKIFICCRNSYFASVFYSFIGKLDSGIEANQLFHIRNHVTLTGLLSEGGVSNGSMKTTPETKSSYIVMKKNHFYGIQPVDPFTTTITSITGGYHNLPFLTVERISVHGTL